MSKSLSDLVMQSSFVALTGMPVAAHVGACGRASLHVSVAWEADFPFEALLRDLVGELNSPWLSHLFQSGANHNMKLCAATFTYFRRRCWFFEKFSFGIVPGGRISLSLSL